MVQAVQYGENSQLNSIQLFFGVNFVVLKQAVQTFKKKEVNFVHKLVR